MLFLDTVSKLGSWLLLYMLGLPENHLPLAMTSASAYPNYIDISSSDSDSDVMEIENYKSESPMRETASSNKSRVLPPWASTSQNHYIPGASRSNNTNRADDRRLMYSSHEPMKRALASSVQHSTHNPQLNNFSGNTHEKNPSQSSGWPNSLNGRTRDNNFAGGANGSYVHEKKPQWTNFCNGKVKENDLGGSKDCDVYEEKAFSTSAWPNTSNGRTKESNLRGDASDSQCRGDAHEKNPSPSSRWQNSQNGRTQENNFRGEASGNQDRDVNGKRPSPPGARPNCPSGKAKENVMWGPEWLKQGKCPQPPTMSSFAGSGDPWVPGRHHPPPGASSFVGPSNPIHAEYGGEDRGALGAADERLVFQAAVQDLHQPTLEVDLPDGLLSVPLLRHQKIALAWMLSKESSGLCLGGILADDQGLGKTISTISLILMQRFKEAKPKTQELCTITEVNLDDDDYGSGAVALYNPNQTTISEDTTAVPQASNKINGLSSKRPKAGTLIVCPASVIRQWAQELQEKVADESRLSVLIYHGPNRTKDPAELAKYDAVLTTYAIVTNEVPKQPSVEDDDDGEQCGVSSSFSMQKKRKKSSDKKKKGKNVIDMSAFDIGGTLARVIWSRVVLDESQMIKNYKTQVAKACSSLKARRRWCLSGTPIQNSIDELFSYFRFLRYDPYDNYKHFIINIKHRISRDSVKGYQKLQVILRNIMLRRTKGTILDGKPIINLPPKTIDLAKGTFSIEERSFYNQLEADSRVQFKAYAAAGTVNQNYANILLLLLRLRQACDHPLLVVKGAEPVGKVSIQMAKMLPRELVVNLVKHLETSSAICLACKDPPENGVVTMCGHVFCYQCVSDNLTGEDTTCPAPECKENLGPDVVYSRTTLRKCIPEITADGDSPISKELSDSLVLRNEYVSSKIKAVIQLLRSNCLFKGKSSGVYDLDEDHASSSCEVSEYSDVRVSEKAIVFSQWTSMLDLLEMSLKSANLNYRRLDGTMSIAARDKAVKDFNTDPKVDVMIMSLKAGNLGLNMIAASRVILLDLWWNPTTEDQAIDRAHRIGQTKPVTVSRLTISDTVEDRILALQEEKRKMVASAFGEEGGGHGSKLTVEDLRFLFGG